MCPQTNLSRRAFLSLAIGSAGLLLPVTAKAQDLSSHQTEDSICVYEGDLILQSDSAGRAAVVGNAGRVSLEWIYSSKSFHWNVTLFPSASKMSIDGNIKLWAYEDNGRKTLKATNYISGSYGQASWSGSWAPYTTAGVNYSGELYVSGYNRSGVPIASSLGSVVQPFYYSS